MNDEEEILTTLKFGSKEEIGRAITTLSRLKDPRYKEILTKIMDSDDPYLAIMAAYALGEAGDKSGFEFLEKAFHSTSHAFASLNKFQELKILEEIIKLPDKVTNACDLYNSSYFTESKEKLTELLNIYSIDIPKMNVPYFDDLVSFSVKKTKGLFLDAIALCEFNLGNIERALQYSLEAISIAEEVNDPQLLKIAYADLGHIHMFLGNYYSALELLHKSLEIDESSHDPWRKKNRILSNLSQLYSTVGQYERAMEYIQEALELSKKESDSNGMARCLNVRGVILCEMDEFADAEECLLEALNLLINELNDNALRGLILNNLSGVYYSSGDIQKAKKCLEEALELSRQWADKSTEGIILTGMAMLDLESDNVDSAVKHAGSALDICMETYNKSGQADANFILGSIEDYFYGNTDRAYNYYREAIVLSEDLRKNLVLDDFKISFTGNYIDVYHQMISLCIRIGKIEDAFEYIERSKSRALVDMFSRVTDEIGSKKIADESLDEINILKGNLDFLRKKLNSAASYLNKETTGTDDRQYGYDTAILEEIDELEGSYKKTFEELKMKDPEWASLVSVDVINLKAVQDLLGDNTLLLELFQAGDEITIIPVRKDKPPTPVRIPLDVESDPERLYNLFLALANGMGIDTRSHEYIKHIKQPLSYFYELLIPPLFGLLEDIKHLIIVPHYFWNYLPFHALYDGVSNEYLIDKFGISYAPSATALSFCCKRNYKQYKSALLIANPSGDLPFAEEEAERIKSKFNDNCHLFKKEQASFDKLSGYSETDVIHLACHGYFRGDEPLFSHLILLDPEGKAMPFFLPDIFNLKLRASLVTLSACETGLSEFTEGDELIGISRAFFYAGASSLLTSLWTVNDRSTALLMDKFYDRLVGKETSKSMALRFAIQELKAMPEYSHPYFWAPFFLSGDWR